MFLKHVDRYLAKSVFVGTFFALLVLFSVDLLIDFINDIENVDDRGFTLKHVLLRLLFGMPQRLYEFMPTGLLLGALIGTGQLASRNELVALRSTGISKAQIMGSILKAGLVLIAISAWVGERVVPTSQGYVNSLNKTQVRLANANSEQSTDTRKIALRSKSGVWVRDGERYINAKAIYPDYRMRDIWVYQLDERHRLKRATFIAQAVYENDVWKLSDIEHSVISAQGIQTTAVEQEHWERLVSPNLFEVITIKPEFMNARTLKKYVNYLDDNELESKRYQLAFYNRFAVPLSGIAMLLLALPFVFRCVRTGGMGQRIVLGTVIAIAFNIASKILSNLSAVYDLPPILGAFLPTLLVIAGVSMVLRRMA